MHFTADELFEQLALLDDTLDAVRERAGKGASADLQRRMQSHARLLRMMLGEDVNTLAGDMVDTVGRVLESNAPQAPLMTLNLIRDTVAAIVRRHAAAAAFGPEPYETASAWAR
jgi:hypothetical protein